VTDAAPCRDNQASRFKNGLGLGLALAGSFVLASSAACAQLGLQVGAGTVRYVAEEPAPSGGLLNREEGELASRSLGLLQRGGDWAWHVTHRQDSGTVEYRGRTQLGLPLRTSTDLGREEFTLGGEHAWPLSDVGLQFAFGTGVEQLRTRRHIRSTPLTGELIETLRTRQWVLAARATHALSLDGRPLRLGASLQAERPWSQRLRVDSSGLLFSALELRPASRWGGRLGVHAAWALGSGLEIGAHIEQQVYRPGAATGSTAIYPGSVQKLRAFAALLSWTP
jgi:hypothetical protein